MISLISRSGTVLEKSLICALVPHISQNVDFLDLAPVLRKCLFWEFLKFKGNQYWAMVLNLRQI